MKSAITLIATLLVCAAANAVDLPSPTVLQVLGVQCGAGTTSLQLTGFSADSLFVTAQASASTKCGASGRGGGYHTTSYSGCAAVTWDLSGNLVSVTPGACQSVVVTPGQVFNDGACSAYTATEVGNVIELLSQ